MIRHLTTILRTIVSFLCTVMPRYATVTWRHGKLFKLLSDDCYIRAVQGLRRGIISQT